jgi:hypothetical protein
VNVTSAIAFDNNSILNFAHGRKGILYVWSSTSSDGRQLPVESVKYDLHGRYYT